jgi:Icc-related predicted phosphoesterase
LSPRLAIVGDVHACFANLEPVLERIEQVGVDGILQVGDIGGHELGRRDPERAPYRYGQYLAGIDAVLARLRAVAPVLWIPGNHDLKGLPGDSQTDGRLSELAGLRVFGIGGAGPDRFGFPYEWDEDEIRALEVPDCDVLLCHAPPRNTPLDLVPARSEHVGSEAIRELASGHPGALVCGHIHESPGVCWVGDCLCLNAGGLGRPWGAPRVGFLEGVDRAWVEDLDTGWRQELSR